LTPRNGWIRGNRSAAASDRCPNDRQPDHDREHDEALLDASRQLEPAQRGDRDGWRHAMTCARLGRMLSTKNVQPCARRATASRLAPTGSGTRPTRWLSAPNAAARRWLAIPGLLSSKSLRTGPWGGQMRRAQRTAAMGGKRRLLK